jgi:hypothetical protein
MNNISYYTEARAKMVDELVSKGYWWYSMENQNGVWMPPTIPRFVDERTPEQQLEAQRLIISKCGAARDFYMNAEITLRDAS